MGYSSASCVQPSPTADDPYGFSLLRSMSIGLSRTESSFVLREAVMTSSYRSGTREYVSRDDLEFLMNTELLRATPDEAKKRLMSSMTRVRLPAGQRLIAQGDKGDCLYLIQSGSCLVSLEKGGKSYPMTRLKAGDIVGELAILTGETRRANVDAETDMALWSIGLASFDEICQEFPVFRAYLTDLATERLCSQKITAERTIGKYKIHDVIGEGGWSIVYKGVHSFLNFPVAIKMLKHNMAIDPDFFETFQNEAKIIASLNHENIVKVYDVEHLYRTIFIVMEHVDGTTLKQILDKRLRMPLSRILPALIQVCSGLDYAHQQGLVHQDVKPGNIFIEKSDLVKIVDFGLACPIGGCSQDLPGTAFYMAPEQIEGDPVDPRTDIYSLGITAYEMATGRRPFPDSVCEVLRAHISEATPDPRLLNPDLPEGFSRLVARATSKEPAARYDNLRQVRDELVRLAEATGTEIRSESRGKRKLMSMVMLYGADRELEINRLLQNFSDQLEKIGARLKVADFDEI